MEPDHSPAIAPARFLVISNHTEGDSWIHTLGAVAYCFGRLEGVSYEIVLAYEPEPTRRKWMGKGFSDRCERAKELLDTKLRPVDPQLADDWLALWAEMVAADAAGIRNKVLHNPLSVGIADMDRFPVGQGIRLVRTSGAPLMGIEEVMGFSATLSKLNHQMDELLARTRFD